MLKLIQINSYILYKYKFKYKEFNLIDIKHQKLFTLQIEMIYRKQLILQIE